VQCMQLRIACSHYFRAAATLTAGATCVGLVAGCSGCLCRCLWVCYACHMLLLPP
jgi:hypothetical protein